ncbi:protein TILLER ANGLE CONTROL 1-like isoform X1 [Primulina eburnea]|uniref:protein TILLER ANGLE CONTROL 1-like isoform X1 n=1 Tax=Primulina eburnea TaxID=1245227 RepID=UPI003C6C51B0
MKIFNWVHRKLKDGSAAQNSKKNGVILDESGDANQFLVDNTTFGDSVFGCWKGGILTIGTFGYDPLTKDAADEVDEQDDDHDLEFLDNDQDQESEELESTENDEAITDSEEEEVYDEEEEANPQVYAVYAHDYEALIQQYDPASDYIKMNGNKDFDQVVMVMKENDRDVDVDMKKERITLADLFSADHWDADDDKLQKKKNKKKLQELMKEKASSKKHGYGRLAFAKKLLLAGGTGDSKNARPIHKLHRLVRRMLKRKIHPELGLLDKEVNESNIKYIPKVNESVPLLPISQDGTGV